MIAYFETSALLKFVLEEEGRPLAHELWDHADAVVTSQLTYVEACAALAAASRAGRLSAPSLRRSIHEVDERWQELSAVDLDAELVANAGMLVQEHALTGADVVHLATVVALRTDDIVFVSWDARLSAGALAAGIPVAPSEPTTGAAGPPASDR